MKLTCGIVMDLLPLYEEDICSEETRQAVEEHLKECHTCRSFLEDVSSFSKENVVEKTENIMEEDKVAIKGFKKVKKQWVRSIIIAIIAMAILIPLGYLGFNEVNKTGIHFTNIREICIGQKFVKELQASNYEQAFEYLNLKDLKIEFEYLGEKKLEDFEKKAYDSFLESTELLREAGGIQRAEYKGVVSSENSEGFEYDLKYDLFVDGIRYRTSFKVSDNGVSRFSTGNSPKDEPIAHLGVWDEWFWQDLNGCYYDFETYKYVYY